MRPSPTSGRVYEPNLERPSAASVPPAGPGDRRRRGRRAGLSGGGFDGRDHLAALLRGQPPEHDGDDGERDRVEEEREAEAARRDEQATDRRPDHEGEVVEGGPGAVGGAELALVADQAGQVGADGRAEEAREARRQDRQRHDRPERTTAGHQERHRQHDHPSGDIRDEEHQPALEPVGHHAGRDREQDVGQDPGRTDDPEQERVGALLVDHDEQGDQVEPVPDRADELAAEEPDERPVRQQGAVGAQRRHPTGSVTNRGRRALISRSLRRRPPGASGVPADRVDDRPATRGGQRPRSRSIGFFDCLRMASRFAQATASRSRSWACWRA